MWVEDVNALRIVQKKKIVELEIPQMISSPITTDLSLTGPTSV